LSIPLHGNIVVEPDLIWFIRPPLCGLKPQVLAFIHIFYMQLLTLIPTVYFVALRRIWRLEEDPTAHLPPLHFSGVLNRCFCGLAVVG
ncbi:hypothetical protein PENTCL1PPCAC_25740, partial [Pristionchus entomophagus]